MLAHTHYVDGPANMYGENIFRHLTSLATDITLGVTVGFAWFSDLQHAVAILAPLGLPVLFILRILAAVEDIRLRRQMRMNAKLHASDNIQGVQNHESP